MLNNKFVNELFQNNEVQDELLHQYPLHSGIRKIEGEFLQKIILDNQFNNTIEIGCAYGISSLYICAASSATGNYHHTIIDPFQAEWKNIGVLNLKRAGFHSYELIEKLSEIALPQLLDSNKKYDFAFIDGWHTFDHVMIDFFYLNRMLKVGGVIAFHDIDIPSQNKLLRYILKFPCYEYLGIVDGSTYLNNKTLNARIKEVFFVKPLKFLSKIVPKRNQHELFSAKIINSNAKLGLNGTLLAIKKISEDNRNWKWFEDF